MISFPNEKQARQNTLLFYEAVIRDFIEIGEEYSDIISNISIVEQTDAASKMHRVKIPFKLRINDQDIRKISPLALYRANELVLTLTAVDKRNQSEFLLLKAGFVGTGSGEVTYARKFIKDITPGSKINVINKMKYLIEIKREFTRAFSNNLNILMKINKK